MSVYRAFSEQQKKLLVFNNWSPADPDDRYTWFDAPLEINEVTQTGLVLHGGCYRDKPNVHVTFELVVTRDGVRRRVPLQRVDWRSVRGGHTVRRGLPGPYAGKRVGPSHYHTFPENYVDEAGKGRMRKGLPYAKPLDPIPESFEGLREYVGNVFRISNIGLVTVPPWDYNLFP